MDTSHYFRWIHTTILGGYIPQFYAGLCIYLYQIYMYSICLQCGILMYFYWKFIALTKHPFSMFDQTTRFHFITIFLPHFLLAGSCAASQSESRSENCSTISIRKILNPVPWLHWFRVVFCAASQASKLISLKVLHLSQQSGSALAHLMACHLFSCPFCICDQNIAHQWCPKILEEIMSNFM